jgi:hypothetical protein
VPATPLLRIHALAALVHPCTSSTFVIPRRKRDSVGRIHSPWAIKIAPTTNSDRVGLMYLRFENDDAFDVEIVDYH